MLQSTIRTLAVEETGIPNYLQPGLINCQNVLPWLIPHPADILFIHGRTHPPITGWWKTILIETPCQLSLQDGLGNIQDYVYTDWPFWNNKWLLTAQKKPLWKAIPSRTHIFSRLAPYLQYVRHLLHPAQVIARTRLRHLNCPMPELISAIVSLQTLLQYAIGQRQIRRRGELTNPWHRDWVIHHQDRQLKLLDIPRKDLHILYATEEQLQPPWRQLNLEPIDVPMDQFWPQEYHSLRSLLPMYRDIIWRAQRNGLPLGYRYQWSNEVETARHLCWDCPRLRETRTIWTECWGTILEAPLEWRDVLFPPYIRLKRRYKALSTTTLKQIWGVFRGSWIHTLWMNRNALIFQRPEATTDSYSLQKQAEAKIIAHLASMLRGKKETRHNTIKILRVMEAQHRYLFTIGLKAFQRNNYAPNGLRPN